MRINQNISAMNTYSRLTSANSAKSKSLEKLSSGLRINRAGDDAAGLAISEKMRGQIKGLNQASKNAQDGISMIQTAEGALNETHSILQRMRELAVQASNDTNTEVDRGEIQKEITELIDEVGRIATTTQFNTQNLLDATGGAAATAEEGKEGVKGKFTLQIGANEDQSLEITFADMQAEALGIADIDISEGHAKATAAITTINTAIEKVSAERSQLGAKQNRLEHTIENLNTTSENLATAESRIRDVDMAQEMMEFTKNNILSQAATSMLAQANQMPQSVLQLLQ